MGKLRRTDWKPVGGEGAPNEQEHRDDASQTTSSDSYNGSEDQGALSNSDSSDQDPETTQSEASSSCDDDPGATDNDVVFDAASDDENVLSQGTEATSDA